MLIFGCRFTTDQRTHLGKTKDPDELATSEEITEPNSVVWLHLVKGNSQSRQTIAASSPRTYDFHGAATSQHRRHILHSFNSNDLPPHTQSFDEPARMLGCENARVCDISFCLFCLHFLNKGFLFFQGSGRLFGVHWESSTTVLDFIMRRSISVVW